jgi:uncharacterized protein YdhG (YjbR/CyaY superfamily)
MKPAKGVPAVADASDAKKIEDYLVAAPEPARVILEEIRQLVRATVPAETTEVFSYGMPGFRYKGALLWYGAFKNHCGFYPGSPPMIKSLAGELKGYKTSKGAIQFPIGKPVPEALLKKIVRLRVAENEARHR